MYIFEAWCTQNFLIFWSWCCVYSQLVTFSTFLFISIFKLPYVFWWHLVVYFVLKVPLCRNIKPCSCLSPINICIPLYGYDVRNMITHYREHCLFCLLEIRVNSRAREIFTVLGFVAQDIWSVHSLIQQVFNYIKDRHLFTNVRVLTKFCVLTETIACASELLISDYVLMLIGEHNNGRCLLILGRLCEVL